MRAPNKEGRARPAGQEAGAALDGKWAVWFGERFRKQVFAFLSRNVILAAEISSELHS